MPQNFTHWAFKLLLKTGMQSNSFESGAPRVIYDKPIEATL